MSDPAASTRSHPSLALGVLAGFALGTAIAVGGAFAWSAGLRRLDSAEPAAIHPLSERVLDQERRLAQLEARAPALDAAAPASALAAAREEGRAAGHAQARVELESTQEEARGRAEQELDRGRAEAQALREELARAKQQLEDLHGELEDQRAARAALESKSGELLERALAAELRERERVQLRSRDGASAGGMVAQPLAGSADWLQQLAQNLPPGALGPQPAPSAEIAPAADESPGASSAEQPSTELARRAEEESASLARERAALEELRTQTNRLIELDGYGELQLVRVGAVAEGRLVDIAFREAGALGEARRFLAARELRVEAFPGLRSLRLHLIDGYEQVGGGVAQPFAEGRRELSFADVRIAEWKLLLEPRGLWHETGTRSKGGLDARYPPARAMAEINALFARAKGTRRFVLRRLDAVQEGGRLEGLELHQLELGGGGLQGIYEAESAELWWDPAQKSAELRLEHGFQRRGTQRVPFFEQRARVFLGFEDDTGWDPDRIPFHLASAVAR